MAKDLSDYFYSNFKKECLRKAMFQLAKAAYHEPTAPKDGLENACSRAIIRSGLSQDRRKCIYNNGQQKLDQKRQLDLSLKRALGPQVDCEYFRMPQGHGKPY